MMFAARFLVTLLLLLNLHAASPFSSHRYLHNGVELKYRHRPPIDSSSSSNSPPLNVICLHPIGVGISSWFFDKLLSSSALPTAHIYAPDLLGTGSTPPFDPTKAGMSFPLDWALQIESFWRTVSSTSDGPCALLSQGGIAPLALSLAHRGNLSRLEKLVLLSPQKYCEVAAPAVSEKEFGKNYGVLTQPVLKPFFRWFLSQSWSVKLFSGLFLFSGKVDPDFVRNCVDEAAALGPAGFEPVAAFNAGALNTRSYEEELRSISVETIVVSGKDDTKDRTAGREGYAGGMKRCVVKVLENGYNNIPWENCDASEEWFF